MRIKKITIATTITMVINITVPKIPGLVIQLSVDIFLSWAWLILGRSVKMKSIK
jgi:hypothetical protein